TSNPGLVAGDDIAIGWQITNAFRADHGVPTDRWCNGVNCASTLNLSPQACCGSTCTCATWTPFFRRKVTTAPVQEGSNWRVTFDVPLPYATKTRDAASIRKVTGLISECGIENLAISNTAGLTSDTDQTSWTTAWSSNQHAAIAFKGVKDCWVRDV